MLIFNGLLFCQTASNFNVSSPHFNAIPKFNYEFSVSLNKYLIGKRELIFRPTFVAIGSQRFNRHSQRYLLANNPNDEDWRIDYDPAILNPWGASNSIEGAILGGSYFLLNKLGLSK
ncbi:MAG: hypothetical protein CVT95_06050 [Bacteroidetes bacterium HGW-Bacteroidetes-12]|nr:MAG: hypothetical protein CVT95_06050 [Bacteroidetes bacterium HGW-Bacteroidetes-12]